MGRRRRAAPAKDDTTEVRKVDTSRTAASQHPLMPDDRVEQHIATIEGIQTEQKKWADQLKRANAVIKAEGMNPKTITDAIKRKKADPLKLRRDAEEQAHVDRIIGLPFQLTVYDIAFATPIDQARAEAKATAMAGRPPENRWAEGTPECDAYREEYAQTQARMAPGSHQLSPEEVEAAVDASLKRPAPPPPPAPGAVIEHVAAEEEPFDTGQPLYRKEEEAQEA